MTRQIHVPLLPARRKISYEEFLNWDGENQHVEWVDGEIVPMPPISGEHDLLTHFLSRVLSDFVETSDLGELRHDPFQMKTGPTLPGRAPDILFVAKRNLARLSSSHLEGPADLVVEVVSPGAKARRRDAEDKLREYEKGGVREYWLIDSERRDAGFFSLRAGKYQAMKISGDGIFRSKVLVGFWLKTNWLWQSPLPTLRSVQQEWQGGK
jgi:Uma2 family endonuclease